MGVGTLDAIAWGFTGTDALLGVVGDAMRGEVYPALFRCAGGRVSRLAADRVARPGEAAAEWAALGESVLLAGNGLRKHGEAFSAALGANARFADEELWRPHPRGLFDAYLALDEGERGEAAPKDPGTLLPVYTRLSDAEENEAARAAAGGALPASGVAGSGGRA